MGRTFRSMVLNEQERALDVGQRLVVAHTRSRVHLCRAHRSADDVDAVERGLSGDALVLAREGERVVADGELEVLGELVLVDDLAHTQPDLVAAGKLGRVHPGLDLLQVALGGAEQLLALVRAQLGQLRIATCHQALARIVR